MRAVIEGAVAALFALLELFPVVGDLVGGVGVGITEDVGMAEYEFVGKLRADVGNVERVVLRTDFGVKENVEKDVAEFLADVAVVLAEQGVAEFVDFLDGVGTEALVGLLAVPRALDAEPVENVEQAAEGVELLLTGVGHWLKFVVHYSSGLRKAPCPTRHRREHL